MKNITVSIDEAIYRNARAWAALRGTSVSALFQDFLKSLARRPLPPLDFYNEEQDTPTPPFPVKP
jgi:hypothetical protein